MALIDMMLVGLAGIPGLLSDCAGSSKRVLLAIGNIIG